MEKIDLYNYNKQKLGKTFIRGQDQLLKDEYYLLEQAWIINHKNEVLLTQRNFNKSYGGMWEGITGHVKSGETGLEGIQREISEEIGLNIEKDELNFLKSFIYKQAIIEVWIIKKDVNLKDFILKNDEVINAKFVSILEFKTMLNTNKIISNLSYFLDIYDKIV